MPCETECKLGDTKLSARWFVCSLPFALTRVTTKLTETALFASRQCSVRTNAKKCSSARLENRKCTKLIELSLSSCGEQVDSYHYSSVLY